MPRSMKALEFACIALIATQAYADAGPQKTALFFNSGAQPTEDSSKNDQMIQESVQAIQKLQKDGYQTQGNVFVRDGNTLASAPNVQNQVADPQAFLDRVKAICSQSKKGDDIAISFAGHGLKDEGNPDPLQNSFYTYQKEKPNVSLLPQDQVKATALEAKVKRSMDAQMKLQNLMANINGGASPDLNEMNQAQSDADQSLTDIATQLGVPMRKVSEILGMGFQNIDTQSPTYNSSAGAADLSRFLIYGLNQDPSLSMKQIVAQYFKHTPFMSMNEIKNAIQECTKNGARVRMTATNCFSGGLLALTDGKGLVCAATQTNPNSVSGNFGMWNQSGKIDSLADMQGLEQQRERRDSLDFETDDGVSSKDYVVNQWVQDLNSSCNNKTSFMCIDQASRQKLCSAFSGSIPNYYKAGVLGLDSRSIPQDILQLAGNPPPAKPQFTPVDPYAHSPQAQAAIQNLRSQEKATFKVMKDAGFDFQADFNSRADINVLVRKFIDYLEQHPEVAKKLRAAVSNEADYGDVFKVVISDSGVISANQKRGSIISLACGSSQRNHSSKLTAYKTRPLKSLTEKSFIKKSLIVTARVRARRITTAQRSAWILLSAV